MGFHLCAGVNLIPNRPSFEAMRLTEFMSVIVPWSAW